MADELAPQGAPTEPAAAEAPETEPQETDWKAEARKWESRAKDNLTAAKANEAAAKRLTAIEDAQKTAEQKAADAVTAAEKRATDAEARALRRDVALEHQLTAEDAALLDTITDEPAMRALAARLVQAAAPAGTRQPKPDRNQGGTGGDASSLGDQFAGFFNTQLGG